MGWAGELAGRAVAGWRSLDRGLRFALVIGIVLRVIPVVLWPVGCIRDECTYRNLAQAIVDGQGLVAAPNGWVWAPGQPLLLALCQAVFGHPNALKGVQIALFPLAAWTMFRICARVAGPRRAQRAGRLGAWALALHPTLIYFWGQIWSEAIYTIALLGAVLSLLWAREGSWARALLPGTLVGLCIMFRGVATYMVPIFLVAVLWPERERLRQALRRRWLHAIALVLAAATVVAPYAGYATQRFGGFMISDATLGQMMWLGNNDFEPVTFDYGNGMLTPRSYRAHTRSGRPHCEEELPAARWNACEVAQGRAWIEAHPEEFARRIPLRLAQLLNPHTFLTRHIRWGYWYRMPWLGQELIVLGTALCSLLVILGGSAAAWLRARGPYGVLAVGIMSYHVAAIALLAGLSRYRVPLEPLWMVFLAVGLADPEALRTGLRSPGRVAGALLTLAVLLPLVGWFLWTGYPGLW